MKFLQKFRTFSSRALHKLRERRRVSLLLAVGLLGAGGIYFLKKSWNEPIYEGPTVAAPDTTIVKKAIAQPTPQVAVAGGDKVKVSKRDSVKAVVQIQASPNRGRSCEEILSKFEELVGDFERTKDLSILDKINQLKMQRDSAAKVPDIIFDFCSKDSTYKAKFYALEGRVDRVYGEL